MVCETISLGNGQAAIVCSGGRRARCACGKLSTLLCDWRVPGRRSGTCDKPLCASCTTSPAPEKDLCPDHARAFARWREARASNEGAS